MEKKHSPRISIGLPVFNGENYLKESLESILSQKFSDFELIISDSASTDRTPEICQEYAQKDKRIHYFRNKEKHGAAWNYNNVFKLSSGLYFKWAAHDDLHHPEHLLKCAQVLDRDPSVVLCCSKIFNIDSHGNRIGIYDYRAQFDSKNPEERFRDVLRKKPVFSLYGVIRRDVLKKSQLLASYIGSDWTLLAELSLAGRFFEIPEFLFFRRTHDQAYTNKYYSKKIKIHDYRTEARWWTGNNKGPLIALPYWKIFVEFNNSIRRSSLSWKKKLACYDELGKWLFKGSGKSLLCGDLKNELQLMRLKLNQSSQNN
ncbi:MAG: glycosyltransferase family 2 protein [Candidatus Bathyarchaeota archaeon]|nr:glycosyltransferase family 2 protein [Candidatus Bathyarchaeum tardum]